MRRNEKKRRRRARKLEARGFDAKDLAIVDGFRFFDNARSYTARELSRFDPAAVHVAANLLRASERRRDMFEARASSLLTAEWRRVSRGERYDLNAYHEHVPRAVWQEKLITLD